MYELPHIINKLNEYLAYLLVFHTYFYWGFQFLKGLLHNVFVSRSALKGEGYEHEDTDFITQHIKVTA
jgi:hypothetical protein